MRKMHSEYSLTSISHESMQFPLSQYAATAARKHAKTLNKDGARGVAGLKFFTPRGGVVLPGEGGRAGKVIRVSRFYRSP